MNKLKIFLMTKNEPELIEDWVKYHAFIFGMENIHILDGSTDEYVLGIYRKYSADGLNVHFSDSGIDHLAQELTDLMHQHKGTGNFLIKLDTDEFLAFSDVFDLRPRTRLGRKLRNVFVGRCDGRGRLKISSMIGALYDQPFRRRRFSANCRDEFFAALPVTGQRYKASLVLWSMPRQEYSARPCYDILSFTHPQFTHVKSFFHSDSFVSVDLGCHGGVSTNNDGLIDTGLTVIHYHSTSIEDSIRRARQVLQAHSYIDVGDTAEQEYEKLAALEGRRISSFHKINLYLSYLRAKKHGQTLSPNVLNRQHQAYRLSTSKKFTFVRDTREAISG